MHARPGILTTTSARLRRLAATALLLALAPGAHAASITLTPSAPAVDTGAAFSLDVDLSGLGEGEIVSGFDFTIGFDPTLVRFDGAVFGTALGLDPDTDRRVVGGQLELYAVSFETDGVLRTLQASGGLRLARLTFGALAPGLATFTWSPDPLGVFGAFDPDGNPLAVAIAAVTPATVRINAPTTVPEPGAASLLLLATGALALAVRRRRPPLV